MSQFTLKLIALFAMLLDHTAKILLSSNALRTELLAPWIGMENELLLKSTMMILGRISFPVFAWFVAEGCRSTRNIQKYALRLLLFAALSEIPFQLCFYRSLEPGCHNVMFTFLLTVAAVLAGNWLEDMKKLPPLPARLLSALPSVCLGWYLYTDYNSWGVALVLGLYYIPDRRGRLLFLAGWITVFQLLWHGWDGTGLVWLSPGTGRIQLLYWLGAMVSVGLLCLYDGRRGRPVKWFFYGFYPLHLLILFLIRLAI